MLMGVSGMTASRIGRTNGIQLEERPAGMSADTQWNRNEVLTSPAKPALHIPELHSVRYLKSIYRFEDLTHCQ